MPISGRRRNPIGDSWVTAHRRRGSHGPASARRHEVGKPCEGCAGGADAGKHERPAARRRLLRCHAGCSLLGRSDNGLDGSGRRLCWRCRFRLDDLRFFFDDDGRALRVRHQQDVPKGSGPFVASTLRAADSRDLHLARSVSAALSQLACRRVAASALERIPHPGNFPGIEIPDTATRPRGEKPVLRRATASRVGAQVESVSSCAE